MRVMRIVSALLLVVGSLPVSTALPAQAVVLDEGTFMVEIDGRTVGTETFRIRRSGFGENAQVIAQGSLELTREGGKQTVESALGTVGVGMSLDAYQVKISGSGELQVRLQRRGDRLVAETTSEAGVEEREYRRPSSRTPHGAPRSLPRAPLLLPRPIPEARRDPRLHHPSAAGRTGGGRAAHGLRGAHLAGRPHPPGPAPAAGPGRSRPRDMAGQSKPGAPGGDSRRGLCSRPAGPAGTCQRQWDTLRD